MKKNCIGTDFNIRELIDSDVSPPVRPRSSDVTQGIVRGAHAFILRISSFFGLAPLRFKSRTNGFAVTLSNGMCIYSYVLITFLVITTILSLAVEINAGKRISFLANSYMSKVVFACNVLVTIFAAGVAVYGAPRRMREMLKFLESVASVDKSIGVPYSVVTERRLCGVIFLALIFFSILMMDDIYLNAMQAMNLNRKWFFVTNYIVFYISWFLMTILELQFAFTALSVQPCFRALNDVLALIAKRVSVPVEKSNEPRPMNVRATHVAPAESQRTTNADNSWMNSLSGQDHAAIIKKSSSGELHLIVPPCEAIRQLASIHGTLCGVVRRINDGYGLPLIVMLISTLLHLIVTPYYIITEIYTFNNKVHFLVLLCLWCGTNILKVFVTVEICHLTITENKKTQELVCSLITHAPVPGALSSRLELFSRQLILRSVTYSPLGMCTLSRPLLVSVFSLVTTYLVILVQFKQYVD